MNITRFVHFDKDRKSFTEAEQLSFLSLAHENFNHWNEALVSKDPKKVALIYSTRDIAFLPTMSKTFIRTQEGVLEYFTSFLKKNPIGSVINGEEIIYVVDENNYSHSGFYDFEVDDHEGGRETIHARFTFSWRRNTLGQWKIIEHHSSKQP